MSQHQPEDSCRLAQAPLASPIGALLPQESDPREPNTPSVAPAELLEAGPAQNHRTQQTPPSALQAPTCARKQPQKCLGGGCGQGGLSSLAQSLGMGQDLSASSTGHQGRWQGLRWFGFRGGSRSTLRLAELLREGKN